MSPANEDLERLSTGKYLLVTTYRRNGNAVPTPVWVVRDGDALGIWTAADTGKVKRIRSDPKVSLTACDSRGKPSGPTVQGRAEILDEADSERYRAAIARKYRLAGRMVLLGSQIRRGRKGTLSIRITLD